MCVYRYYHFTDLCEQINIHRYIEREGNRENRETERERKNSISLSLSLSLSIYMYT